MTDAPKEADIQKAIVEFLDVALPKTHRAFAVPNAAKRSKGKRASNAVPGLRKGVPDLAIVGQGRIWFIEVKRNTKAKLSEHQDEWASWCFCLGNTPWVRAEDVDHVRMALKQWNIKTREAK